MVLAALAWSKRDQFRRSPWPATGLLVLVCVQGLFGALTVTMKLMPGIVTIHLLLGVFLLCALGMLAGRSTPAAIAPPLAARLASPARIALAVVFLQIALGGWVSTNYAVLACQDFPLCNGALMPETDFARGFDFTRPLGLNDDGSLLPLQALVAIHWTHRVFALLVLLATGFLVARLYAAGEQAPFLRRSAWVLGGLLALQVATGVSNVVFAWPLAVAVMHNGGAAALALTLALLNSRLAAQGQARPAMAAVPAGS